MPRVGKVLPIVGDSSSANANSNTPQAPSDAGGGNTREAVDVG